MMTIKEFAALCACSTQTLRYYDRIGLLKPMRVDRFTGYRYYEKQQALDFVKIKNLQAADFTIEEIKRLLTQSDDQVYEAFNVKIAQQTRKLKRIREIQQSYLNEKNTMEQAIHNLTDFLMRQLSDADGLMEFGLQPEDLDRIVSHVRSYMERWLSASTGSPQTISLMVDDEIFRGAKRVSEKISTLEPEHLSSTILLGDETLSQQDVFRPEAFTPIWAAHGFAHVYEFIDEIPPLQDGENYGFFFELNEQSYREDVSFPMFMLGAMILKKGAAQVQMGCSIERSKDNLNHFTLMHEK